MSRAKEIIKSYLVDTTASVIGSTPPFAAMELFVADMNAESSLEIRTKVLLLAYGGLGFAYTKLRDVSRNVFKITAETKERIKTTHDMIYNSAWSATFSYVLYSTSYNAIDEQQATYGTAASLILSLATGIINGYSIDLMREFTGTAPPRRKLPEKIRNASSKTKKLLAAAMIGTSIAITSGIYYVKSKTVEPQQIQNKIIYLEPSRRKENIYRIAA